MSGDGNPLARAGGLSYLHIPAVDPGQSARFYQQLFGWRIDHRGGDDFRFADPGGLLIGVTVPSEADGGTETAHTRTLEKLRTRNLALPAGKY